MPDRRVLYDASALSRLGYGGTGKIMIVALAVLSLLAAIVLLDLTMLGRHDIGGISMDDPHARAAPEAGAADAEEGRDVLRGAGLGRQADRGVTAERGGA